MNGQFSILSGLSPPGSRHQGRRLGRSHARFGGLARRGVSRYDRTRPGVEVKLATTADQIAAKVFGAQSPIPSIEMTVDPAAQGSCDSGDCFYVNTFSWRNETTPNARKTTPA